MICEWGGADGGSVNRFFGGSVLAKARLAKPLLSRIRSMLLAPCSLLITQLLFTFYIPTRYSAGETCVSGSSYGEIVKSTFMLAFHRPHGRLAARGHGGGWLS